MREIKFRAWNHAVKKMLHFDNLIGIADGEDRYGMFLPCVEKKMFIGGKSEIMQYTGLKDKNGKEIYEGDILQSNDYHNKYIVIWKNNGFNTEWTYNNSTCYICNSFAQISKVIGNIYENPELIQ